MVEQHHRDAHHTLTVQTRTASIEDLLKSLPGKREVFETDRYTSSMTRHKEKNDATHDLSDNCGEGSSTDAEIEDKDKQWVEGYIKHRPRHDPHHGISRIALQTKLIVQCQRSGQERGTQEYDAEIVHRIRQDALGGSQRKRQRTQQQQTNHHDKHAHQKGQHKASGCHLRRIAMPSGPELTRDIVA